MQIKLKYILIGISVLSVALILIVTLAPMFLMVRIVIGFPFLVFFPGYTLVAALYPKRTSLDSRGRLLLSFGLSIAIIPLLGFALNFSPWGIQLYSILVSLAIVTASLSAVSWYKGRAFTDHEKPDITLKLPSLRLKDADGWDRGLSVILIVAILGTMGALGYAIPRQIVWERFTELYVLGNDARAAYYPQDLIVGEEARIILGITNHEHDRMKYQVEVVTDGTDSSFVGPIELEDTQRWEQAIGLVQRRPSAHTKLTESVYQPYGPILDQQRRLRVESIDHVQPGDRIWIGDLSNKELAVVQTVDGNELTLEGPIRTYHPAGSPVIGSRDVVFRLFKIRDVVGDHDTSASLGLWLGPTEAVAIVANTGQTNVTYQMEIRMTSADGRKVDVQSIPPVSLVAGAATKQEIVYKFGEADPERIEFLVYGDGQVLYKEEVAHGYPHVHLWMDVKERRFLTE